MEVKNYMEILVADELENILLTSDICKCNKCKNDIMALALNALPPRYIVTDQGEIYAKVDYLGQQLRISIITALTNAIIAVSNNLQHDK